MAAGEMKLSTGELVTPSIAGVKFVLTREHEKLENRALYLELVRMLNSKVDAEIVRQVMVDYRRSECDLMPRDEFVDWMKRRVRVEQRKSATE